MARKKPRIRPGRPTRSKHADAIVALFRTTDRIRTALSRLLEPHDLTPQQYNVLRILRGAGPDSLPTLAIIDRMIEHAPGITRMIDRLENKGLVTRERVADDRRRVNCRITRRGLEILDGLDRTVADFDRRAFRGLDPRELARLTALLDRVRTTPRA
ncbi:MAG: MarR family transcriptional regulator [Gemmatimonadetes bacterium]|nr:MarR family transcriptional regulator [Gemmatimonadota bacterium]